MKILFISDLHLCDKRNSIAFEKRRMSKLAEFIGSCGCDLVVNLGDAVSRREFLRPEFSCEAEGFDYYLAWRNTLSVPFIECAIDREFAFFEAKTGQKPDSFREVSPDLSIITVAPKEANDHRFTGEQLDFLENALASCRTPAVVIASHVPYPGSCSRAVAPGIFLEIPERLRELLENSPRRIYWAGGHFHWAEEPVAHFGSLAAFHGGRFSFESLESDGYLRMLETAAGQVTTVINSFRW